MIALSTITSFSVNKDLTLIDSTIMVEVSDLFVKMIKNSRLVLRNISLCTYEASIHILN